MVGEKRTDVKETLMKRNRRNVRTGMTFILGCVAVLGTLVLPTVPSAAGAAGTTPADTVIEWNANAQAAIIGTAAQGPTVAYLHLAMVQGAVYDAVNAIEGGYEPYLEAPTTADPADSSPAAVATAAHDVLFALFPSQQPTLDAQLAASLAAIPDGPAKTGGIEVGAAAAAAMLVERTGDGRFTPFTIVEGFDPGKWRRTPPAFAFEPAPWVGNVRPFIVADARALRSDGPNALSARKYAKEFNEVKELGSLTSRTRTADQTDAALFWQANGAGLFNAILRQLADTQDLDIAEAARMFAMANLAGADGAIACWNDKYYWNFWRPITAIHEADRDGNPATVADANWTPLFATPPFPEHPSGHTCISGAVVKTLRHFFGTDKVSFSTFSTFSNSTRSFDRFSDAIEEIVDARVSAGIHFRTADDQGYVIGRKVAHELSKNYFERVTDRSCLAWSRAKRGEAVHVERRDDVCVHGSVLRKRAQPMLGRKAESSTSRSGKASATTSPPNPASLPDLDDPIVRRRFVCSFAPGSFGISPQLPYDLEGGLDCRGLDGAGP
jgi:hypothetical protein